MRYYKTFNYIIFFFLLIKICSGQGDTTKGIKINMEMLFGPLLTSNSYGINYGANFILKLNNNVFAIGILAGHPIHFNINEEKIKQVYSFNGVQVAYQFFPGKKKRTLHPFIEYTLVYKRFIDKGKVRIFYNTVYDDSFGSYKSVRNSFEQFIGGGLKLLFSNGLYIRGSVGLGGAYIVTKYDNELVSNIKYNDINYTVILKTGIGYGKKKK